MASVADSDLIAALLYLSGHEVFASEPWRLHEAVFAARDFAPALRSFGFTSSGVHHISRALDDAMGVLRLARLVRMENTEYDRFLLDPDGHKYVEEEVLPRLDEQEIILLRRAASLVGAVCGATAA